MLWAADSSSMTRIERAKTVSLAKQTGKAVSETATNADVYNIRRQPRKDQIMANS